uniref:RNA replicase n=1 Tax=Hubei noda-like virus 7 TaxID=1922987 RepID=A0A1L3KGH6_9VIRU|nr:hypothetical protein 1 [Hubei noda-like virus 7]
MEPGLLLSFRAATADFFLLLMLCSGATMLLLVARLAYHAIRWAVLFIRVIQLRTCFSREAYSALVEEYGTRLPDLRPSLKVRDFPLFASPKGHTHGDAAAERSAVNAAMAQKVREIGRTPYHIAMSRADQDRGDDGLRHFYWDKDLKTEYRNDEIREDHVLICTDVDYYLDMEKYLSYGLPVLMYTVVPQQAAHRSKDQCYHIKDNEICYEVAGGGRYQHPLWNYDTDTIRASANTVRGPLAWAWALFSGVFGESIIFDVEQKIVVGNGSDHRLISLIPTFRMPTFLARFTPGNQILSRREYTKNGVNTVYEPVAGTISMALNGSRDEVTLPSRVLRAVTARLASKTTAYTVGDIEVFLQDQFPNTSKIEASLLYEILQQSGLSIDYRPNIIASGALITNYRPMASRPLEAEKSVGAAVTSPLTAEPALFASRCYDSDTVAVAGRVTKVANTVVPPPVYKSWADEFVKLLVPKFGCGTPYDLDTVIQKQDRPTQRDRTARALHALGLGGRNRLKTFIKAEPYASVTDPRIITTCATDLTIGMSRFTYAFKDTILKRMPWYGPGKTPTGVAKRLATICSGPVVETDYSRFDGTISEWLQSVAKAAYMRWFTPSEAAVLDKHYQEVFRSGAVSQNGLRYAAGVGTRSGSPITTDANTMINAFINYCGYRKIGRSDVEAFKLLGIYAGDDGVSRNEPGFERALEEVTREVGLSVKAEVVPPGGRVTFLSRVFPSPSTSLSSHQCVKRTLPKIHLTASTNITREQAAYNRAIGYLATDRLTPLLSNWCKRVIELSGIKSAKGLTGEDEYKLNASWPQAPEDEQLILDSVARDLGMTTAEVLERAAVIDAAPNLDAMPIIWNNTREIKIPAMVDGILHSPRGQSENDNQTTGNGRRLPSPSSSVNGARRGPGPNKHSNGAQATQQGSRPIPQGALKRELRGRPTGNHPNGSQRPRN